MSKSGALTGTYAFDLLGRMTSSDVNNVVSTYAYDGNGIRTSKTVSGVTTNFINDGAYVVGEVSGDSVVKYIYGNGLINIINNGTIGYYHTDEHGNVSAISNFDREIVADYDFDAFGNETVSTDTYYNPMRYCGEYYDDETGLIYLRARYYAPSIGRFISEDPHWNLDNMIYGDNHRTVKAVVVDNRIEYYDKNNIQVIDESYSNGDLRNKTELIKADIEGPEVFELIRKPNTESIAQSNNLYVYCSNNPISFVDPSGEGKVSGTLTVIAGGLGIAASVSSGTIFGFPASLVLGVAAGITTVAAGVADFLGAP